jgi:hypothetical protein
MVRMPHIQQGCALQRLRPLGPLEHPATTTLLPLLLEPLCISQSTQNYSLILCCRGLIHLDFPATRASGRNLCFSCGEQDVGEDPRREPAFCWPGRATLRQPLRRLTHIQQQYHCFYLCVPHVHQGPPIHPCCGSEHYLIINPRVQSGGIRVQDSLATLLPLWKGQLLFHQVGVLLSSAEPQSIEAAHG